MTTIDETLPVTDPGEIRRILEERAEALAQSPDDEDVGEVVVLVIVGIGRERYGVPIEMVREITSLEAVTPLFATPPFWVGLTNLRGSLYAVLDLRRYLGIPGGAGGDEPQLVLVGAGTLTIGLRVDEVIEVRDVPASEIGPPLAERGADRADIHVGLTRDLVSVLDVAALLGDPSLVVQEGLDLT
jgi:chemotaxis signal transduction protein